MLIDLQVTKDDLRFEATTTIIESVALTNANAKLHLGLLQQILKPTATDKLPVGGHW
jgi:hypothetical protein